jgi:apoptosis-inducing factor 2
MSQTTSRVVIIGGGFAGCKIAQLLLAEQSMQVTLIDPKDFFEMVWVNPRALVAPDWGQRSIFPYTSFIPRVLHVKDEAASLDAKKVTTKSGKTIEFDFCVIAVGSSYAGFLKASPSVASASQRLSELHALSEQIQRAAHVLVVGGGAMPPDL